MKANLMNNYRRKQQAKAFADKILDEQAIAGAAKKTASETPKNARV